MVNDKTGASERIWRKDTDLQMTDDAVGLLPPHPTCGRGLQALLSSNQQVPCCRVTAAVGTAVVVVRLLAEGSSHDWKHMGGGLTVSEEQQCRSALSIPAGKYTQRKNFLSDQQNQKCSLFLRKELRDGWCNHRRHRS